MSWSCFEEKKWNHASSEIELLDMKETAHWEIPKSEALILGKIKNLVDWSKKVDQTVG